MKFSKEGQTLRISTYIKLYKDGKMIHSYGSPILARIISHIGTRKWDKVYLKVCYGNINCYNSGNYYSKSSFLSALKAFTEKELLKYFGI